MSLIPFISMVVLLAAPLCMAAERLSCDDPAFDRPRPSPGSTPVSEQPARDHNESNPGEIEKLTRTVPINGRNTPVKFERHRAWITPSKGTVVYFCGGPGVSCSSEGRPGSIPPDMDVVLFDYMGVRDNAGVANTEQMSIESQAQVGVGLIKSLNLNNYVLYGSSFGTTVATVATAQLSNSSGVRKPKMVVLDGVVSRGQDLNHEAAIGRAANRAWDLLSSEDRQKFTSRYDAAVANMSAKDRSVLDGHLIGSLEGSPRDAADALRDFTNGNLRRSPNMPESEATNRQYRAAGCQQLRPRQAPNAERFFGGRVQNTRIGVDAAEEQTPCDCPLIDRPFNSQQHQIKNIPILYINSETDVLTPIEGARQHMSTQTSTREKLLLSVRDGGHGDLEGLTTCSGLVWNAAMRGSLPAIRSNLAAVQSNGCRRTSIASPADAAR